MAVEGTPKAKDLICNCFSTMMNLKRKRVEVNLSCPFCTIFNESTFHCLVSCEYAWSCWSLSGIEVCDRNMGSFRTWLEEVFRQSNKNVTVRVVMLCWCLWKTRNEVVWNHKKRTVEDIVAFSTLSLNQWNEAQGVEGIPSCNHYFQVMGLSIGRNRFQIQLNLMWMRLCLMNGEVTLLLW